ncbi:MAG TPA: TIGR03560 family F420-dependent LLM class oxidoreductase [Chloroflexia bacterium]|nr:TIGR03560 family F420-dependent LLM class oxidoreductase [Chloroflexia bacterium]
MSPRPLRIDLKTAPHNTTYADMQRYWADADAHPAITGLWLFDHFLPLTEDYSGPCLEGWTLLAALATQTHRLRVGQMVTCNTYRYPAVLANMGATVDILAGGRLDFGIGAGWYEREHRMYNIPFPSAADRIRALGEACALIKLLWTQEVSDYAGRYYRLEGARSEPKPVQQPHPPFMIGGGGEQLTLRVVAEHAAMWNLAGASPDEARHKLAVLDRHCQAIGRDPATIGKSFQVYLRAATEVPGLAGRLREYVGLGFDHFVIGVPGTYIPGLVEQIVEELRPLRADE